MRNSKKKLLVIFIMVFAVLFTSCGDKKVSINDKKVEIKEQNKIELSMNPIKTLNPLVSLDKDVYYLSKLIYEGLFTFDKDYTPVKSLARNYAFDRSTGAINVDLTKRIKWHDGEDFTSNDVVFTINAIKAIGVAGPYYEKVNKIYSVKKRGTYGVRIDFKDKNDMSLDLLSFPILPAHKFNGAYSVSSQREGFKPVGTGLYKYKSYSYAKSLKLVPNENYRNEKARSSINVNVVSSDKHLVKLVESSNISALIDSSLGRETKIEKKGVKIKDFISNEMDFIGFNFKKEEMQKKSLRTAIAYATDSKSIIEESYLNSGAISDSLYPPSYLGSKKRSQTYKFSLEKAAKVLKKAGYEDIDQDGVIENLDKNNVVINILVNSDRPVRVKVAEDIKANLEDLDMQVNVIAVPEKAYLSSLKGGKYDIFVGGMEFDEGFDLRSLLDKEAINNYTGYVNAELSENLTKLKSGDTPENNIETVNRIKEILDNDLPYYCVCYRTIGFIKAPTLEGEIDPTFNNIYNGINNWYSRLEKTIVEEDNK
ncbi:MAG: ABC transporter substrate-binding protein [Anaerovoracaceae bacterium]